MEAPRQDSRSVTADWWWIFDPRLSLRARAVVFFGGGTLIVVLVVTWLAGAQLRRQLRDQTGRHFELLAQQASDKLDRALYERREHLLFLTTLEPFRRMDAPVAERRRVLEASLDSGREFAWLGLVEPSGIVSAATQGYRENTQVGTKPWFRLAREQTYAGSVHEDPELARQVRAADGEGPLRFLDFAVAATSPRGEFVGVLAAQVRWPGWARDIQFSVLPESAARERIGITVYDANGEVLLDSGGSGWSEPPTAPVVPNRRGHLAETTAFGASYTTGYVRSRGFRDFRGFGWLVTVRQPIAYVYAPVDALQRTLLGWGLLLFCAVVIITWFTTARFARRLGIITVAAERIGAGDVLSTMPRPAGESELSRMCAALGYMVEKLRANSRAPSAPPPSAKRPW